MANRRTPFFQISLVFAILLFIFVLDALRPGTPFYWGLDNIPRLIEKSSTKLIYGTGSLVFFVLLLVRETQTARFVQIAVIILFGTLVTIFVTPREIGGDLMFILAAVLAYKYGFFERGFFPKLVMIVGALIATRIGLAVFSDKLEFRQAIAQFAIALAIIPIVYWIFEEELQRTAREKRRLELRARHNQPFVEFGRNVSGIVHDFKNDLGLFSMFGQLLRINGGEPVSQRQITEYEGYVQRLSERIERILAVTRISQTDEVRSVEIIALLKSVMYVFQSNLDFKRVVHFSVDVPDQPVEVRSYPAEIVSIFENVVRNSCEALVEHYGERDDVVSKGFLSVTCRVHPTSVTVIVSDNGPGIPHCRHCAEQNCLECSIFGVGKTTKVNGSGLGLTNVRTAAQRIGAQVVMKSEAGGGVETEITIPRGIDGVTR